jgi:hypothetical protein
MRWIPGRFQAARKACFLSGAGGLPAVSRRTAQAQAGLGHVQTCGLARRGSLRRHSSGPVRRAIRVTVRCSDLIYPSLHSWQCLSPMPRQGQGPAVCVERQKLHHAFGQPGRVPCCTGMGWQMRVWLEPWPLSSPPASTCCPMSLGNAAQLDELRRSGPLEGTSPGRRVPVRAHAALLPLSRPCGAPESGGHHDPPRIPRSTAGDLPRESMALRAAASNQ